MKELSMGEKYCIIAALRYQLPRQSYGNGIVNDFIRLMASRIDKSSLEVMVRDITEALGDGTVVPRCRNEWVVLRDFLSAHTVA